MKLGNAGFTLIELVVVIVILGILSATAVPRFLNIHRDARIAALEGFKASVADANHMVRAKATIEGKDTQDRLPITEIFPDYTCVKNGDYGCDPEGMGAYGPTGVIFDGEMASDLETFIYFIDGLVPLQNWTLVQDVGEIGFETDIAYSEDWAIDYNRGNRELRIYPVGFDLDRLGVGHSECYVGYRNAFTETAETKAELRIKSEDC